MHLLDIKGFGDEEIMAWITVLCGERRKTQFLKFEGAKR